MSIVGKEPVVIQALATIVVWAATRYGLNISDEQALQIAGGAFVVLAPFVRQLVRPVAKQEAPLTDEEMAHARELLNARERLATSAQRYGQVSPARTVPPQKSPGPPPPPPAGRPAE